MAGYKLAEHPDILLKLREEVLAKVGMRRPSYEDIRDLKYLRAFINEVLRLYPPVNAVARGYLLSHSEA
ncbi:hypothetical protein PHLCEN_2v3572 [Hermanssonia centrifuga]|uniref:Cytochrome P450 n=1 Tax=Hermanssonia centrifuga TaxID=98765 RepID=A0A2R6QER0_9APHY|nr:hypothetical protein PHLCEN_2v3572 [Hermanssonia centrifuga]